MPFFVRFSNIREFFKPFCLLGVRGRKQVSACFLLFALHLLLPQILLLLQVFQLSSVFQLSRYSEFLQPEYLQLSPSSAFALDTVVWKPTPESEPVTTVGRVLTVAQDRSLLLQERNGSIHPIEYEMIQKATRNQIEFVPMTQDELAETYLERLPEGFQSHKTEHFVLFFKTSKEYARWNGILLERLYAVFENFWRKRGMDLQEPEFPLFCVIFPNRQEYHAFADAEGESVGSSVIAYYNYQTNRIVCFDLSGQETYAADSIDPRTGKVKKSRSVNFYAFTRDMLERPNAEKQIATIIHEAVHQLVHNRGLAQRFGDVPLWYNEGIALFFESPNMKSERGWTGIGYPNPFWAPYFKQYLAHRPMGHLEQLLTNDTLFQTTGEAQNSYAESWMLTWHLLKTQPKKFTEYAKIMGKKPILIWDSHEERVQEFEKIFGPLEKFEKKFIRSAQKVNFNL